ncbi:P63C domain-containing protein [Hymenobacter psoromatis]|uniref:P63C domain-containing protein n=1 Tax=Hymenobacter psoromatis TaxID=1484116 RepID=UPI001CBC1102|nr:P63C domain-containing protein [Hymenobacter psoromatis]
MEKSRKITHEGELDLNGVKIPCYVLEDGTRLIAARGIQTAIKLVDGPVSDAAKSSGVALSRFLNINWLKSLIVKGNKLEHFEPVSVHKGRQRINGYEATMLVEFCDIMLDARKQGLLKTERQYIVADQCEILIRSLARVGVIALVDEATGYQYDRERDELQKILKAYIGEELLAWRKRFPDEFYREIFRLNGWDFTVKGIKQRPGIIGTWTKQFIYAPMPRGVLPALIDKTPQPTGKRKPKLHQALSEDTGVPHLEKQLVSVVTLMNVSNDWKEFKGLFERKFGQQVLDFGDKEIDDIPPRSDFDIVLTGLLSVPPPSKDDKPGRPSDEEDDETGAEEVES